MTMYLVVGCHRSGTSLVANVLHESGIVMGTEETFYPEPNDENPNGLYENRDFRIINDKILKNTGYDVKSWQTVIPYEKTSSSLNKEMKNILEMYSWKYKDWGWKDPRTCLTWRVWLPFLKKYNVKVVYVYRNPLSVANSLLKRRSVESIEHGLAIWQVYNLRAIEITREFDTIHINYDTFLETGKLIGFNSENIVDKQLRHNEEKYIPEECKRLWQEITSSEK